MNCRFCNTPLVHTLIDLGHAPPSNAYLSIDALKLPETYYPLTVKLCGKCWLVQTEDYADPSELFSAGYAYFSSTSASWLNHASNYADMITRKLSLNPSSFIIEIASNDGYLLKNFVSKGIRCMGIEPTENTARQAESIGVETRRDFFCEKLGQELAIEGMRADLLIGNNVYAHVPDINDFTKGLKAALKPHGTVTLEFPHLMRLVDNLQFDTIYHEHFSYLSLDIVVQIFTEAGLKIIDAEEISTHGGSLRIYGAHEEDARSVQTSVEEILEKERSRGLKNIDTYGEFQRTAYKVKNDLLEFLINKTNNSETVAAYGAAAKGNTLLNFAGIKPDLLPFVCDAAPSKQGMYLPGSHIPIVPPKTLTEYRPDYVIILPWNLADEVKAELSILVESSTRYVTLIPELKIF